MKSGYEIDKNYINPDDAISKDDGVSAGVFI